MKDNNVSVEEYEKYVSSVRPGSFMQASDWIKVKAGWECERIAIRDDAGNIKGAMQLLIRRIPVVGTCYMYAPRGPVCDLHDKQAVAELTELAVETAKKHHAYILKVDPMVESDDKEAIGNLVAAGFQAPNNAEDELIQSLKNYILEINGRSEEEVFASFDSKWRYKIRVAERKGVVCRYENNNLDDFQMLMKETGERDHFQIRSKEYFQGILDAFGDNARLYMCYAPDGEPISGALIVNYAGRVNYIYGASGNGHRNLMPNYLMQWSMIRWAVETGCLIYDFMGVPHFEDENHPNYGVFRFKKGFNGRPVTYAGEFDMILSKSKQKLVTMAMRLKGYKHG